MSRQPQKDNPMTTLYARLEPTRDELLKKYAPLTLARNLKKHRDAVFYSDRDCTQLFARIPWHHRNRPTSRRHVTLNCARYAVEWVNA